MKTAKYITTAVLGILVGLLLKYLLTLDVLVIPVCIAVAAIVSYLVYDNFDRVIDKAKSILNHLLFP